MNKTFDFSWQSPEGLTLRGHCWLPADEQPVALLCLVHGFGEHVGRFAPIAHYLCQQQIGLVGYDQRGHGKTDGKRGYAPSYESLQQDLGSFLALVREKFPELPLFLYGHSMGGNLALYHLLRFQPPFLKGAVVTSPWIRLSSPPSKLLVGVGRTLSKVYGKLTMPVMLDVKGLSRDEQVGKAYLKDPLVHYFMGAKLFLGANQAGEWILQHAAQLQTPTLLMHGQADPITSCQASEEFARKAPKKQLTFRPWAEMRHELQHEIGKQDVWQAIGQYVLGQLQMA